VATRDQAQRFCCAEQWPMSMPQAVCSMHSAAAAYAYMRACMCTLCAVLACSLLYGTWLQGCFNLLNCTWLSKPLYACVAALKSSLPLACMCERVAGVHISMGIAHRYLPRIKHLVKLDAKFLDYVRDVIGLASKSLLTNMASRTPEFAAEAPVVVAFVCKDNGCIAWPGSLHFGRAEHVKGLHQSAALPDSVFLTSSGCAQPRPGTGRSVRKIPQQPPPVVRLELAPQLDPSRA